MVGLLPGVFVAFAFVWVVLVPAEEDDRGVVVVVYERWLSSAIGSNWKIPDSVRVPFIPFCVSWYTPPLDASWDCTLRIVVLSAAPLLVAIKSCHPPAWAPPVLVSG